MTTLQMRSCIDDIIQRCKRFNKAKVWKGGSVEVETQLDPFIELDAMLDVWELADKQNQETLQEALKERDRYKRLFEMANTVLGHQDALLKYFTTFKRITEASCELQPPTA